MIKATDLTFRYPNTTANTLEGLNIEVPKGKFAILDAAGGKGKSTLVKLLFALHRPTSGELTVNGSDLSRLRDVAGYRRSIGLVSEDVGLLSDRTLAENVALPLDLAKVTRSKAKERLTEILHRFGLEHLRYERPAALSDGERRKTMLARSLINEPLLLILDEPSLALDPATASALWDHLFREHQRGMTILALVSSVPADPRVEQCLRLTV